MMNKFVEKMISFRIYQNEKQKFNELKNEFHLNHSELIRAALDTYIFSKEKIAKNASKTKKKFG